MKNKKPKLKAPWYRALHGDKPKVKVRKRVKSASAKRSRELAAYNRAVAIWKRGRLCACDEYFGCDEDGNFNDFVCRPDLHLCEDCHHMRGRRGPLLLDQRFWLPVCRRAHAWIDANRELARECGWLAPMGEYNTLPKEL